MADVHVIAGAYTADTSKYAGLTATASKHGVPLKMLGGGVIGHWEANQMGLWDQGFKDLMAELARLPDDDIAVITDSFDVLVARWDKEEIITRIELAGGLLVSAECNCFPDGPWRAKYDTESVSPWRYSNGGQMAGNVSRLRELYSIINSRRPEMGVGLGQQILHFLHEEDYPFSLDRDCKIFNPMFASPNGHLQLNGNVANTVTGSHPMFLHFNGKAPGLREWKALLA